MNRTAGPYSIGSTHWNGLSKLIEEAGEVQQVAGKIMGADGGPLHWDGTSVRERLEEEIADVLAACRYVIVHNNLNDARITERMYDKFEIFNKWNKECGK
jgi:NTP pyrophosphatase (non-canonical NTP hydrolase)